MQNLFLGSLFAVLYQNRVRLRCLWSAWVTCSGQRQRNICCLSEAWSFLWI